MVCSTGQIERGALIRLLTSKGSYDTGTTSVHLVSLITKFHDNQGLSRKVEFLYTEFMSTLELLKKIADPQIRSVFEEDLRKVYSEMQEIYTLGEFNHKAQNYLRLVLSGSIEGWLQISKISPNLRAREVLSG
ncbi:hypothetical protein KR52_10310 [Synechococcus sp. KORDI-52]|nr:hypothetical protein KR52_10310 [Synechococcus sp. KORDI-52]